MKLTAAVFMVLLAGCEMSLDYTKQDMTQFGSEFFLPGLIIAWVYIVERREKKLDEKVQWLQGEVAQWKGATVRLQNVIDRLENRLNK